MADLNAPEKAVSIDVRWGQWLAMLTTLSNRATAGVAIAEEIRDRPIVTNADAIQALRDLAELQRLTLEDLGDFMARSRQLYEDLRELARRNLA